MLPLLLLFVPPPPPRAERPVEVASLTPARAADLAGKLRLFKVVLDSAGTEYNGRVGYDAQHDDEPPIRGSCYLEREVADDVTTIYVRGVLKVIKHPRRGSKGQYGGYTEYWVVGTVQSVS